MTTLRTFCAAERARARGLVRARVVTDRLHRASRCHEHRARATTALPAGAGAEQLVTQFAYDKAAPLQLRETPGVASGGVANGDVEYADGRGGVAKATLFVPAGAAKRPALLMSPGSNQSRADMRSEALSYAGMGVAVLVRRV